MRQWLSVVIGVGLVLSPRPSIFQRMTECAPVVFPKPLRDSKRAWGDSTDRASTATLWQDPRRAPPNPTTPERPKGTAITFGGKGHEEILPNPYRFSQPPEVVSAEVAEVLKELELPVDERESRPRMGVFRTDWYVFSKGLPTKSELLRVADLPNGDLHNWTRARYRVEIRVALIEPNATMVTVTADIEGFAQDIMSSTWIRGRSRGVIENNILRALRERLELK
jgi:hypothetical protein